MITSKFSHAIKGFSLAASYLLLSTALIFSIHVPKLWSASPKDISNAALKNVIYLLNANTSELVMLLIIAGLTALFATIERKDADFCGVPLSRVSLRRFLQGCFLSLLGSALLTLFEYCYGGFRIIGLVWPPATTAMVALLSTTWLLVLGVTEELWFRGYALKRLEENFGWWPAAIMTSMAFAMCHLHNQGENFVEVALLFLSGMILCSLRRVSGSLWLGIGAHTVADLAGSILGSPGSDLSHSPTQIVYLSVKGSPLINGGDNGVMFSLPGIAMQFLLLLLPITFFSMKPAKAAV
ncbi:type II CAAX endopeptidase family protein [Acetobacter farinalis]|uniref:Type II CAAX endopeptidase family protein n=1 Tax=Acetobacter farinalis TaxID=1260984 RepID=A0ABT3Q4I8_9PROT|nr:type II CAAX endopeptidase family protein [Acetobacter farinalis]NHO28851.1 CPBP family intramembrane metalloprotease [Acetobacter farinalis]